MASPNQTIRLNPPDTLALLAEISALGSVTTIVIHHGHVFEYKGEFPSGSMAEGYYNLHAEQGFTGHLRLAAIHHIDMVCGQHRGRDTYYWQFCHDNGDVAFKVFLGRDANGDVISRQKQWFLDRFQQLNRSIPA